MKDLKKVTCIANAINLRNKLVIEPNAINALMKDHALFTITEDRRSVDDELDE